MKIDLKYSGKKTYGNEDPSSNYEITVRFDESEMVLRCSFCDREKGKGNGRDYLKSTVKGFDLSMSLEEAQRIAKAVIVNSLPYQRPGEIQRWKTHTPAEVELPDNLWQKKIKFHWNGSNSEVKVINSSDYFITKIDFRVCYWLYDESNEQFEEINTVTRQIDLLPHRSHRMGFGPGDTKWKYEPSSFRWCSATKVFGRAMRGTDES